MLLRMSRAAAVLLLAWLQPVAASEPARLEALTAFAATDHFVVQSEATGRPHQVFVRKPEGYDNAPDAFPTVYALDGDIAFPILAAYHVLLTIDTGVPEALIIGVGYGAFSPADGNFRSYDYSTPPFGKEYGLGGAPDEAGGAAAFHRFLVEELAPRIERDYRADPGRRILFGQSRGAHFVLYSAYNAPDAFWGRIASNPSLQPNREVFFANLADRPASASKLYFSSGAHDWPRLRTDALALFEHLADQDSLPWALKTVSIPNGTHAAFLTEAYRQGIAWLFDVDAAPPPELEGAH